MKSWLYPVLLSLSLGVSLVWSAHAANAKGKAVPAKVAPPGDPVLGKDKADAERCIECHGVDGHGAGHANGPEGKFAKLAGQHPDYILKQIRDFRSGARKHDQMAIMARSVTDEDVRDIAAYFASQPGMKGEGGDAHTVGRRLYEQGDATRGVLACVQCHGAQGKGVAALPLVPVIGGQEWRYLDQQLRDWRSGERRNSADGVMNQVLKPLTDAELESLALYLSGL